jgi:hypothetical protein
MKRMLVMLAVVFAALALVSMLHFEGEVKAVGPKLALPIQGSEPWYAQPLLASRRDDAGAVYVVAPALPAGAMFSAIRVDTKSGEETATTIALDPSSPFQTFKPADARADVAGIHFERPALSLFSLPDGKGPGVHRVDSATGRLSVKTDGRTLLTRKVFNSSTTAETLSLVSADPNGHWLAAFTRSGTGGWKLFLFTRNRVEES